MYNLHYQKANLQYFFFLLKFFWKNPSKKCRLYLLFSRSKENGRTRGRPFRLNSHGFNYQLLSVLSALASACLGVSSFGVFSNTIGFLAPGVSVEYSGWTFVYAQLQFSSFTL